MRARLIWFVLIPIRGSFCPLILLSFLSFFISLMLHNFHSFFSSYHPIFRIYNLIFLKVIFPWEFFALLLPLFLPLPLKFTLTLTLPLTRSFPLTYIIPLILPPTPPLSLPLSLTLTFTLTLSLTSPLCLALSQLASCSNKIRPASCNPYMGKQLSVPNTNLEILLK